MSVHEIGAIASDGGWITATAIPALPSVKACLDFFASRPDLELVDFAAAVGDVLLSTHDDGEARLECRSFSDAVVLLRGILGDRAGEVVPYVCAHPGKYIALRGAELLAFDTFDDYLANG